MRIGDVRVAESSKAVRVTAVAEWERRAAPEERIELIYGGVDAGEVSGTGDALLVAMLFFAMTAGEDIRLDLPVSARLLAGIPSVVELNKRWHPSWYETRVEAEGVQRSPVPGLAVGSFFSGGVDSFATALLPRDDPITVLVTLVGLDIRFDQRAAGGKIVPRLAAAAAELGLRHVVVDTNVFEIGHRYFSRAEHLGSVLGSVALGLGGMLRRCFVPTASGLEPRPWGAQVVAYPQWRTETLELCNDGAEESRHDKLVRTIASDAALSALRVCIRDPASYNCGRCDKCVGTAIALSELGAIDRCTTLTRIRPAAIGRTRLSASWLSEFKDLHEWVTDPEVKRAVGRAMRRNQIVRAAEPALSAVRRARARQRLKLWEKPARSERDA